MEWTPGRIAAVLAAIVFAAAAIVLDLYDGELFWPALVTQFAATLAAVFLALELEGRRERSRLAEVAEQTNGQRATEASKRLRALDRELAANKTSLDEIAQGLMRAATGLPLVLNPQLLDRAWLANSERLGDLLADYELMSDLAFFYGRIEELRWRVRLRTELTGQSGLAVQGQRMTLEGMTRPLVDELKLEVANLIPRVGNPQPEIRVISPPSIVHPREIGGTRAATIER